MLTPFNELVTAEPTWAELTIAVDIRVIGLLNRIGVFPEFIS